MARASRRLLNRLEWWQAPRVRPSSSEGGAPQGLPAACMAGQVGGKWRSTCGAHRERPI